MPGTTANRGYFYLDIGGSGVTVANGDLDAIDEDMQAALLGVGIAVSASGKNSCHVGTTAALTATYANGTLGVGATLTNAGAQAALVLDGVTLAAADRVLVKDQASGLQNGLYTVTNVGSGATNWILTRATDVDETDEMARGMYTVVSHGTTQARTLWIQTATGPFTVGTTALVFASAVVTIGAGQVTLAMLADLATDRLIGRDTAGTGVPESLTVGGGVVFTGSGGIAVSDASDTLAGKVELATISETSTGTDAARAVTPDGLAGSIYGTFIVSVMVTDPNGSAATTGDGKAFWFVPFELDGCDLVSVSMGVTTVSSSGIPTVQIANVSQSADMLSTKLTVDASENHSKTAATPAVIDTGNDDVLFGDLLRFDIDVAGTGCKGICVTMGFRKP